MSDMGTGSEPSVEERMDWWFGTIRVRRRLHKATSVMLFKKSSEAEAHKRRLDSIQSEKKRWKSTEIINLKQPASRANEQPPRRVGADAPALFSRRKCVKRGRTDGIGIECVGARRRSGVPDMWEARGVRAP